MTRVSAEAAELFRGADVVDAHVESFVWSRLFGYDLGARHGPGPLRGALFSQADLPRMADAGVDGAVMSIATNPLRRRVGRTETLLGNLLRLRAAVEAAGRAVVVADLAGYRRARAQGRLACFLAVQGGNAFGRPDDVGRVPDGLVSRVTLVHLTPSSIGWPSSVGGGKQRGLGRDGAALVETLDAHRVIVDLAHINPAGFWDALAVHDRSQPAIVSHTGVKGVHDCWRNVDDDQLRAIADQGGVVGIMFHSAFLGDRFWSGAADAVVRHVEHVVAVAGEDTPAIGSDFDGLIVPPADLRTASAMPVLAQRMLDRGFTPLRVRKVLGANYLRVVGEVRPGPATAAS